MSLSFFNESTCLSEACNEHFKSSTSLRSTKQQSNQDNFTLATGQQRSWSYLDSTKLPQISQGSDYLIKLLDSYILLIYSNETDEYSRTFSKFYNLAMTKFLLDTNWENEEMRKIRHIPVTSPRASFSLSARPRFFMFNSVSLAACFSRSLLSTCSGVSKQNKDKSRDISPLRNTLPSKALH